MAPARHFLRRSILLSCFPTDSLVSGRAFGASDYTPERSGLQGSGIRRQSCSPVSCRRHGASKRMADRVYAPEHTRPYLIPEGAWLRMSRKDIGPVAIGGVFVIRCVTFRITFGCSQFRLFCGALRGRHRGGARSRKWPQDPEHGALNQGSTAPDTPGFRLKRAEPGTGTCDRCGPFRCLILS